jgi:YHS domain-containing protein
MLLWAFAIYFGFKALRAFTYSVYRRGSKQSEPVAEKWNSVRGAAEMVRDPVCGLYISSREAISLVRLGKTLYFCSDKCMQRFMNRGC